MKLLFLPIFCPPDVPSIRIRTAPDGRYFFELLDGDDEVQAQTIHSLSDALRQAASAMDRHNPQRLPYKVEMEE